jgi:hypothetical protein
VSEPTTAPDVGHEQASAWLLERPPVRAGRAWWPSLAGFALAGGIAWWGAPTSAAWLAALVVLRTVVVFVWPRAMGRLERGLGWAIGGAIAHLFITPIWLLFLVPLGMITRRRRRMFEAPPRWQAHVGDEPGHGRWS